MRSVLVLGAGPVIIGQGCEFDYSGTQACRALKQSGFYVILINPNPATIMTDPEVANRTYMEPLEIETVTKVIAKERPHALLPTVGGQTALNLSVELHKRGVLEEYGVELLGVSPDTIVRSEDRKKFREIVESLGLQCPENIVIESLDHIDSSLKNLKFPVIIRPSFTLGGLGGGIAYNLPEYREYVKNALILSPIQTVQVDQSLIGWKEYEMEVIVDRDGNAIIVCAIENIDPVGIHTGDSVVVSPTLTLTDKEYQRMRNASIAIVQAMHIIGSGANVQFAVNPKNGKMLVIEMNPRVSRSSTLASKTTGYPIAKVSAMLASGKVLSDVQNECTKPLPAAFEPTMDYVVTKIPRFDCEKFNQDHTLSSAMKSTGEVMAIGANFKQSFQKALCALDVGYSGLDSIIPPSEKETMSTQLQKLQKNKLLYIADALRQGFDVETVADLSLYNPWFIDQIQEILALEHQIQNLSDQALDAPFLQTLKKAGFSDQRIATLLNTSASEIYALRKKFNVMPSFKRVDTCAGEFSTQTAYLYSSYQGHHLSPNYCEACPSDREKVIILGNGCNRIGQGIEFDYTCVHASLAVKEMGYESIMINSNPSTVSTDYEISDKLYLEPLTTEHIINILDCESRKGTVVGVIVQMGGQTPLKLAQSIERAGYTILGTSIDSIDIAEDRDRFKSFAQDLSLKLPKSDVVYHPNEFTQTIEKIGLPVLLRPSYVLGGAAMAVLEDSAAVGAYLQKNASIFRSAAPLLIDEFLKGALEIDVDAVSDGTHIYIGGIMEHIEEAGVHSGDSTCSLPPRSLSQPHIQRIIDLTKQIAIALKIRGLLNVQYALKDQDIYVLEANPRASRTIPFVNKAIGISMARLATQVILGKALQHDHYECMAKHSHIAVKMPVFPFNKFKNADPILGPQMKSTGESIGMSASFGGAFAKAFIAAGQTLPLSGTVFISIKASDKTQAIVNIAQRLLNMGFELLATDGTASFLKKHHIPVRIIQKVRQGRPHIVDAILSGDIALVINSTEGTKAIEDSHSIRRTALVMGVTCVMTLQGAGAMLEAIETFKNQKLGVLAIQDIFL